MTESSPAPNGDVASAGAGASAAPAPEEKWGQVVLTISNSVMPLEKLSPTPSSLDGMTQAVEDDLRNLGCDLIQTAGKLLKLPQVAMATACVIFQRFFYSRSFVRMKMEVVAMGCVCLSCKIEEDPRRPRDVINVFNHIKQVRMGKPIKPVVLDEVYVRLKRDVLNAERRVLKDLGFCVHIKHPHKLIVMFLQLLSADSNTKFVQMSWNFMNDSLRTDIFVRYQPEIIACACIYLSARKLNIALPKKPAWYELLNVEEDDIRDCCYRIICLYQRTKPVAEDLDKIVNTLKEALDEKKRQEKKQKETSTVDSPSSQVTSPGRKEKSENGEKSKEAERSRSRSNDRNKRKKKHKQRDRSNSGSDRDKRDKKENKKKRERSWSRSPIRKERRERSRDRGHRSSGQSHDRRQDRNDHKGYQDKYKKGERIERDHYRR